jgi:hypothetical protein
VAYSFDFVVFGLRFVGGNHGHLLRASLCLILIPQTPSSAPVEGFRLEPRFLVEFGGDSIPGVLVHLRTQVLGHSIP